MSNFKVDNLVCNSINNIDILQVLKELASASGLSSAAIDSIVSYTPSENTESTGNVENGTLKYTPIFDGACENGEVKVIDPCPYDMTKDYTIYCEITFTSDDFNSNPIIAGYPRGGDEFVLNVEGSTKLLRFANRAGGVNGFKSLKGVAVEGLNKFILQHSVDNTIKIIWNGVEVEQDGGFDHVDTYTGTALTIGGVAGGTFDRNNFPSVFKIYEGIVDPLETINEVTTDPSKDNDLTTTEIKEKYLSNSQSLMNELLVSATLNVTEDSGSRTIYNTLRDGGMHVDRPSSNGTNIEISLEFSNEVNISGFGGNVEGSHKRYPLDTSLCYGENNDKVVDYTNGNTTDDTYYLFFANNVYSTKWKLIILSRSQDADFSIIDPFFDITKKS